MTRKYNSALQALYGTQSLDPLKRIPDTARPRGEPEIKPSIPTEAEDQARLVKELRRRGLFVFAIPNSGKRSVWGGQRERAMGLLAGVPDLFLAQPYGGYSGCFVEMKRVKGGIISESQQDCIRQLNILGYMAFVAHGFDEAMQLVSNYMGW